MKTEFYKQWSFWVMIVLALALVISLEGSEENYKAEYNECMDIATEMSAAWTEYQEAIENYCILDYTNLLCKILVP